MNAASLRPDRPAVTSMDAPSRSQHDPGPLSGAGNTLADFERVALPYLDDVARVAGWLTNDEAEAADLVQDTYLNALRGWRSFRLGTDCRAWLLTICRNHFRSLRRRPDRVNHLDTPELETLASVEVFRTAVSTGMDAAFGKFDLRDAVQRELRALPEPFREAVALVDLEDLPYEEAAGILGVPVGTVRSRLYRGRRLLQERLLVHARDAGFLDVVESENQGAPDET